MTWYCEESWSAARGSAGLGQNGDPVDQIGTFSVHGGIVLEVLRGFRQAVQDSGDEVVPGLELKIGVGFLLSPQGGRRLVAQVCAAQGAGPVGRKDHGSVSRFGELLGPGVVHHGSQGRSGNRASHEVRPADTAHEERVARKDDVGRGRLLRTEHIPAEPVRRVARRFHNAKGGLANRDCRSFPYGLVGVFRPARCVAENGAGSCFGHFRVPRHEVRVGVGEENTLNGESILCRDLQIGLDVPAGIDHQDLSAAHEEVGVMRQNGEGQLNDFEPGIVICIDDLVRSRIEAVGGRFRILDGCGTEWLLPGYPIRKGDKDEDRDSNDLSHPTTSNLCLF
jgi:hypothetical protein